MTPTRSALRRPLLLGLAGALAAVCAPFGTPAAQAAVPQPYWLTVTFDATTFPQLDDCEYIHCESTADLYGGVALDLWGQ